MSGVGGSVGPDATSLLILLTADTAPYRNSCPRAAPAYAAAPPRNWPNGCASRFLRVLESTSAGRSTPRTLLSSQRWGRRRRTPRTARRGRGRLSCSACSPGHRNRWFVTGVVGNCWFVTKLAVAGPAFAATFRKRYPKIKNPRSIGATKPTLPPLLDQPLHRRPEIIPPASCTCCCFCLTMEGQCARPFLFFPCHFFSTP